LVTVAKDEVRAFHKHADPRQHDHLQLCRGAWRKVVHKDSVGGLYFQVIVFKYPNYIKQKGLQTW